MPLEIVRNDITKMRVDAIVNAANSALTGGGGVDGAIHRAAGPGLLKECIGLHGCAVGDAKITGAYRLPCKYVIHTVGPRWHGGGRGERDALTSCYRKSLELARQHGFRTVAFPLISSGAYGYPKDLALRVAVSAIEAHLSQCDMYVYLVVFDRSAYQIGEALARDIVAYIDDHYVSLHEIRRRSETVDASEGAPFAPPQQPLPPDDEDDGVFDAHSKSQTMAFPSPFLCGSANVFDSCSLREALGQLDESFSEMLLRKIDEKGITDAQCYKKANIDRKLFSKIRKDRLYKPSKATVLAFAIALELPMEEVDEMLKKAGFALSHSNKFDVIVEYFLRKGIYDVFEINEALFAFDQNLLGVS